MEKYKLITPTKEIVSRYVSFWKKTNEKNDSKYIIQIFEDGEMVDVRKFLGNGYCGNLLKDEKIKAEWDKGNVKEFLTRINSTYSTRVKNLKKLN